jgi:hypothetical protein
MKSTYRILLTSLAAGSCLLLQGCDTLNTMGQSLSSSHYDYNNYYNDRTSNNSSFFFGGNSEPRRQNVHVPRSYHMSNGSTPTSHKQRDGNWVESQNPNGYTVQVDEHNQPANVANTLMQTPKNKRNAQIKQNNNGQTSYKGVYGTYQNKESATKAIEQLPAGLKGKAKVKQWGSVQKNMDNQ